MRLFDTIGMNNAASAAALVVTASGEKCCCRSKYVEGLKFKTWRKVCRCMLAKFSCACNSPGEVWLTGP